MSPYSSTDWYAYKYPPPTHTHTCTHTHTYTPTHPQIHTRVHARMRRHITTDITDHTHRMQMRLHASTHRNARACRSPPKHAHARKHTTAVDLSTGQSPLASKNRSIFRSAEIIQSSFNRWTGSESNSTSRQHEITFSAFLRDYGEKSIVWHQNLSSAVLLDRRLPNFILVNSKSETAML